MSWKLNPDRPVYVQLIERITTDIIAGIYPPGSKLPSVRDLAQTAGVNPNTMQKALSEMERTNLVYSQRTSGRFITEDLSMIDDLKTELASEQIKEFLEKMEKIGLSKEDIIGLINKVSEEEKNEYDSGLPGPDKTLWQ